MSSSDSVAWHLAAARHHLLATSALTEQRYRDEGLHWASKDDIMSATHCAVEDIERALYVVTHPSEEAR